MNGEAPHTSTGKKTPRIGESSRLGSLLNAGCIAEKRNIIV
jgi:hypothetical protein